MAEMGEEQIQQNTKFSSPKSLEKVQLLILLVGGLLQQNTNLFSTEMSSTSAQARNSAFLTLACLAAAPFALVMLLVGFQFNTTFFAVKTNFQVGGDSLSRRGGCPGERRVTHFLVFQVSNSFGSWLTITLCLQKASKHCLGRNPIVCAGYMYCICRTHTVACAAFNHQHLMAALKCCSGCCPDSSCSWPFQLHALIFPSIQPFSACHIKRCRQY